MEQSGLGAGARIGPQTLVGQYDDPLGSDRLDANVERTCLARGIGPGLDQAHIFLEDRVLHRDTQRQQPVQPTLDRWQPFEQNAFIIDQFKAGHF
jgi:hypothetical protein